MSSAWSAGSSSARSRLISSAANGRGTCLGLRIVSSCSTGLVGHSLFLTPHRPKVLKQARLTWSVDIFAP